VEQVTATQTKIQTLKQATVTFTIRLKWQDNDSVNTFPQFNVHCRIFLLQNFNLNLHDKLSSPRNAARTKNNAQRRIMALARLRSDILHGSIRGTLVPSDFVRHLRS
jgi:hypothetical protein